MNKAVVGLVLSFLSIPAFAAPIGIPGVSHHVVAQCVASPELVGDVGVMGIYKATVTETIPEFGPSFYEVAIVSTRVDHVISVLRGSEDEEGNLVLDQTTGPRPAGFNQVFELPKGSNIATWTSVREFGPAEHILFICNR